MFKIIFFLKPLRLNLDLLAFQKYQQDKTSSSEG